MINIYAGIGSRKTPPHIQKIMFESAKILAKQGAVLRSGGAVGLMKSKKPLSLDKSAIQLLEIEQRKINEYIEWKNKSIITKKILGKQVGIIFAESYISELGNRLAILHPELDLIAMVSMDGKVSYRTAKDDIDLGKNFASVFGGGGHRKAAGSEFGKEIIENFIQEVFGGEEL